MKGYWLRFTNTFFRDITTVGGTVFYLLVLISTFLLDEKIVAFKLVLGFLFSFLIIVLIRLFYFKNRPQKEKYHTFPERIEASSFPSWHTARALFLALLFGSMGPSRTISIFLIILAVLVMYSRIFLKKHDGIDVLGGIVLGVITFWITTLL